MELAARIGTMAVSGITAQDFVDKILRKENLGKLIIDVRLWFSDLLFAGIVADEIEFVNGVLPLGSNPHALRGCKIGKLTVYATRNSVGMRNYSFQCTVDEFHLKSDGYFESYALADMICKDFYLEKTSRSKVKSYNLLNAINKSRNPTVHCIDGRFEYNSETASWDEYDAASNAPLQLGGGYKCLTPRRSYRQSYARSARFCARTSAWEVAA